MRRFTERGRTGAYLAVVSPGTITTGDVVEVADRPEHGITVPEVFRALMGDGPAAERVVRRGRPRRRGHDRLARRVPA